MFCVVLKLQGAIQRSLHRSRCLPVKEKTFRFKYGTYCDMTYCVWLSPHRWKEVGTEVLKWETKTTLYVKYLWGEIFKTFQSSVVWFDWHQHHAVFVSCHFKEDDTAVLILCWVRITVRWITDRSAQLAVPEHLVQLVTAEWFNARIPWARFWLWSFNPNVPISF